MKMRFRRLSLLFAFVAVLMSASVALAESSDGTVPAIFTGIALLVGLVIVVGFYIYMALALQTIATKTGTADTWLAWIPIINLVLLLNVAKKPIWWIVLFLIPIANLVVIVIVWMAVAQARRKPDWLGILMIVPLANFIIPGYLAWSD
jgi:hypothetical protein